MVVWVDLIGHVFCQSDNFLLKQLPKQIIYHINKTQDINSNLCGSYCLYFFYLIERMRYYDTD